MLRVVVTAIVIAGLGYGGYVYWQRTRPAPVVTAPAPIVRAPRLAPAGVFFLTRYRSVTTATGVTGFAPGTKVTLVREDGAKRRVTDGSVEFDAAADDLTNDLDVATRVASGDARAQAEISKIIARQSAAISVLAATYGCEGGTRDVTLDVQARVGRGERAIQAGNDLAGDPAPGCVKTLAITYALGGAAPVTATAREGQSISFAGAPPAPPAVTERRVEAPPTRSNRLDRPAYDQKENVARPPVIRYVPPPPPRP